MRIYLPQKVIIHRGRKAEVNITLEGGFMRIYLPQKVIIHLGLEGR